MRLTFTALSIIILTLCLSVSYGQQPLLQSSPVPYTGQYKIKEGHFAIWDGRGYVQQFIKGINLGVSVPGTQPGQLAANSDDYRRWFHLIREAGYNTIRLYTLHYPRFYDELERFNLENPTSPLLVIQGIWLEENEGEADLFDQSGAFSQEIREVVRAVHGDIQIEHRFGKAYGTFSTDISPWVTGFLPGREIFPGEVALTNQNNPQENAYDGRYLYLDNGGDPVEVWLSRMIDSLMIFEYDNYNTVRPTGFSSWPTLDPLVHPTEQLLGDSQEDDEQIDLSNLVSNDSSGGFFLGYHAYPYYPDFIVQDPRYRAESDAWGPNSYLGYLKALKKHYGDIPLLVAEFGVPSSWGSGHFSSSGMDHGGLTEEEQGGFTLRMLDNMYEAGFAGGIQFSLIDEWFKQTWITNPLSDRDYRHFWHNISSPEQNFGILAYDPPPEPFFHAGSYPGRKISRIGLSSDYTYFRIRLYLDTDLFREDTIWIALDTYEKNLGESKLPDQTSIGSGSDTLRAEFALSLPVGGQTAQLYVIPSYDVFGVKELTRVDTVVSTRTDKGMWNQVRWKTNYAYNFTQYIGKLTISSPEDPYHSLHPVSVYKDSLDIRLPWTLLNFPAPTVRRAMHYKAFMDGPVIQVLQRDTLSDGIALTVSNESELYQTDRYTWSPWDYEKIVNQPPIERKKESFHILKQGLPEYNSAPIGRKDSFSLVPGSILEVQPENGLLANDFDIDGNALRSILAFGNGTSKGSLHLHPDGSFTYLPDPGFTGEDFFMYYLEDGRTNSTLVPVMLHTGYPLNIAELASGAQISIFPNPGKDQICISLPEFFGSASLRIVDMTGREMFYRELNQSKTWINIADLEAGVYLFYVRIDQIVKPERIIIK